MFKFGVSTLHNQYFFIEPKFCKFLGSFWLVYGILMANYV